jgi:enediyne polyketide synthase
VSKLAVVGMACRYPDAASPKELWENAITGRRAFRRLPDERLPLADYWDADPSVPDRFYSQNAAVIEGYEFDRVGYKIAGSTYRSTDLTHWLALDVAAQALVDAGFPGAEGLPRERTCVIVGNTLTGEFTRANTMRLRWPYVRRTVAAALEAENWDQERVTAFLANLEADYKSPFPGIDEDTLAGGLSNTIAGRICNYFDLKGGGYTVDGACSSSLLSVATACKSLVDGDVDVAIAGGVDLSIDPFEMVGFAKTGALAVREMRVYDRDSNGFWPGEGCGMVVLMRESDALAARHRVYATIAGWGISSDGRGGITRPEIGGHHLALRRAYERAGFGIDTVPMFEGHGTGTQVGDATELKALSSARASADPQVSPAAISSIKGVIGHTKAAAGVAGLIKAVMAVHEEVLPPTIGCVDPHPALAEEPVALRVLRKAEPWPCGAEVRAGITSMGFGGINTHIVLENTAPQRRDSLDVRTRAMASSIQDAELLLVDGDSPEGLRDRLTQLIDFVPSLSYAQLGDLAATLQRELRDLSYRAAVVVSSPQDAEWRLRQVLRTLEAGETTLLESDGRGFLRKVSGRGRIGYLFPGQGSGHGTSGGALRRRLAEVEKVYARAALATTGDMVATAVAQPRIVTGSAAALSALSALGIEAEVSVGHSLGEISALHWAGAMDEEMLLRLAAARGRIMNEHSAAGTMAGISATPDTVSKLAEGLPVVIAGYNGPAQTVIAGSLEAIEAFGRRADQARTRWTMLQVSHAFHSPLVAPAAESFGGWLDGEEFGPVGRRIISTVTGEALAADTGVPGLLRRQITAPVLFAQAMELAAKEIDLFIEVGPGRVLSGLAAALTDVPVVSLDTDDEHLLGLLQVAGAAYALGTPVRHEALFNGRLTRPLEVGAEPRFFASPCEAPTLRLGTTRRPVTAGAPPAKNEPLDGIHQGGTVNDEETPEGIPPEGGGTAETSLELLRRLVAERAELPVAMVTDDSRLLDNLHLSSITVGQIVNQVARRLGRPAIQAPTNLATATLRELAVELDTVAATAGPRYAGPPLDVAGAATWVRGFRIDLDELPLPERKAPRVSGSWAVYATHGHPLAEPLRRELKRRNLGSGVLVCLPADCGVEDLEPALEGAKAAAAGAPDSRFVLVQAGRGAAGLAKTLCQEAPHVRTTVVHVPPGPWTVSRTVAEVAAEVAATDRFTEVYYDAGGVRRVPTLRAIPVRSTRTRTPLDDTDVLLVTGGGKGITAECALALAADNGARLAVLGRSDPEQDPELSANLRRMAESGVTVRYACADITDPADVRAAVTELAGVLGPITALLHGAGRNEPGALTGLDMEAFRRTFAPKIDGLRGVLEAIEADRLRLLVTFGSILGRTGLRGEAHYATANEWLACLTREVADRYPQCRTLCLEWSVWSGVGMGERLAVAEGLARDGITPITPDQGVRLLRRLVTDPDAPTTVVISGRTGAIDTVRRELPELPLLRYVDKPLVRYHGVELITEVDLNAGTDPYLADHRLDGDLLFPAVLGMEAMAQVASAATGWTTMPVIEDVEFLRPIVVPPDGATTIRIAAAVTDADTVEVAIRSAETNFAAEHFRARLRYSGGEIPEGPPSQVGDDLPPVPLEPARELYGDVLFQGDRFRRLRRYHRVAARQVDAEVATLEREDWFAAFLPAYLLLGDPGMRDALMHGNQVCVPDATLLPSGIERVYPTRTTTAATRRLRYCATERHRDGDSYLYDIAVRDERGDVVERWEGLRLRAVRKGDGRGPWVAPLLGPYLERAVEDLLGIRVAVAVEPDGPNGLGEAGRDAQHRAHTAIAVGRACGHRVTVRYRPDGRPEIDGNRMISSSHGSRLTLGVVADQTVGCDIETVVARPAQEWKGLLGRHTPVAHLLAVESGEGADTAGTRVWAAIECLRKAGLPADAPLTMTTAGRHPWKVFSSGALRVATLVTTVRDVPAPVVFAILAEGRS